VNQLYAPQSLGGHGLLSVQDTFTIEGAAIVSYMQSVDELLLMTVQDYGWFPHSDESLVSKSALQTNHFNLLKSKPLHGQFLRDI